jgi:hypothetical protein
MAFLDGFYMLLHFLNILEHLTLMRKVEKTNSFLEVETAVEMACP